MAAPSLSAGDASGERGGRSADFAAMAMGTATAGASATEGVTWLVANAASGSNSATALAAVGAVLAQSGCAPARLLDVRDGLPDRAQLRAAGVGRIVVFAGDGTVARLATALEGWDGALLVLPGGTTNLLARALHGDRPADAIAADLPHLVRQRRPCIRWNGGTALIEVLAGPGATWCDVREELRDGVPHQVAGAAVAALHESTVGALVALVDPPLGRGEGYSGIRLDLGGGTMMVEGYGAATIGEYLRQGIALLRRNYREGPHDALGSHPAVTCCSVAGAPIPLMVDGERAEGAASLRFSLAPFALDLLGPPG